jgi:hypothetical protein
MAERQDGNRGGSEPDSAASESVKQQRHSGQQGGPRAPQQQPEPRNEPQPPQTSGRRDPAHEHEPSVRRGYEAAEEPERQGDGDPGPDRIRQSSAQQGHGGAGGAGRVGAEDRTAEADRGSPAGEHTRRGRQQAPGDRDPQQPG